MLRRLIAAGLGLGAVITAIPAHAADNCAERAQVVTRLQEQYSEQLTAGGLHGQTSKTSVVEVWSSPETGTFTVMVTDAQGQSCIVATGTDWYAQNAMALSEDTAS
ncbi:hypothetical protein N4R57_20440 [Rhodobacteraceae bacterium D3-12]|nr:hypothetical protein N4R57_20440 [Rhodobacteraceae bacterium D3-12]